MADIDEAELTLRAEAAFRQAARSVIRVARQTGTPIVIWKDGRVQEIPADRLDALDPIRPQDTATAPEAGPVAPA